MKQVVTALIAITCFTASALQTAPGQVPATVTVGFRNRTNVTVIVQGYTIVNNFQRRGQTLKVPPQGGVAFESGVPSGFRYYTIYDANQTLRIFLRNYPVPIQGRDLNFSIEPSPTHPGQMILRPLP